MSKSILVTGGAGYIGSHMVKMLLESGYKVTTLDNLARGHKDAVIGGEFIECDLLDRDNLKKSLKNKKYDAVIHFAAFAYVEESVKYPNKYYLNNVCGTLNLLDTLNEIGTNSFVFSSSCATYGIPQEIPITEDHPQNPINPYGYTKVIIEKVLKDLAIAFGQKSVSLRYFNAAGCDPDGKLGERHHPETHLIPLALQEALRVKKGGDPSDTQLQIYGIDYDTDDGTCIRDYIHVVDLCSAHLLALRRIFSTQSSGTEYYNLGNGKGFSILEVIKAASKVTGVEIRYKESPRRIGDPACLVGSSSLAKEILGWNPKFTELEKIVETSWHWLINNS